MKKILFVFSSTKSYSGAEVLLFRMSSYFKNKFKIIGLFPDRGEIYKSWTKNGMEAIVIPFIAPGRRSLSFPRIFVFFPFNLIYTIFTALEILRRHIDIVHINDVYNLPGMLAGRIAGKKVICHTLAGLVPSRLFKAIVFKCAIFLSHRMIFASNAVRDLWCEGRVNISKMSVIYNMPPDTEEFDPSKYKKQDEELFLVGMVAKICREKGHHYFVEAAHKLKEAGYTNFRYHIVGGQMPGHEAYYNEIIRLIDSYGLTNDFVLHGMTNEVVRLLSKIDIFIHTPDCQDGLPIVVFEAMLMEKPVVCFDIGGISEQFVNGESGMLVPFRNIERLIAEIIILYEKPQKRQLLGKNAREHVISRFSHKAIANSFIQLYHDLIKT